MITVATTDVGQTRDVAAAVAGLTTAGDLLLLTGELGAGKTAFVQGFAEALGVTDPVTSPTFTLAHRYDGRLTVNHLDVYRLSQLAEVVDLAIPELLEGDSVTLIEWGDMIVAALPADYLEIAFTFGDGPDDRSLGFRSVGAGWSNRHEALAEAVGGWAVGAC